MRRCLLILCFSALFACPSFALGGVHSPNNLVQGELGFEYSGSRTIDDVHADNNNQEHELELEYGATDRWMPGIGVEFTKEPDDHIKTDKIGVESTFQFWEPGEKWVDAGIQIEYGHSFAPHDPDAVEAKLLLEKQAGSFVHRANVGAEQAIGGNSGGGPALSVLWSSRYVLNDHFKPGFEVQSFLGKDGEISGSFEKQEHYAGPAAYGKIGDSLNYRAAYLFGISDAATDGVARIQLLYVMDFQ